MKILTFDTSLNKTYITYGEDEKIIISKAINSSDEKYHSAYLVPEIINILKEQNITMQNIDAIGINEGPGSFTGIRICTVIARVAAQQLNINVVPVPSLEILSNINQTNKNSLVILDARKNKVYYAIYDKDNNFIKQPDSMNFEDIVELIKSNDYEIIADTSISNKLEENNVQSINYENKEYPLGEYLYKTTINKLKTSEDFHWAKAKPLYIQPPSITMSKKVGA